MISGGQSPSSGCYTHTGLNTFRLSAGVTKLEVPASAYLLPGRAMEADLGRGEEEERERELTMLALSSSPEATASSSFSFYSVTYHPSFLESIHPLLLNHV